MCISEQEDKDFLRARDWGYAVVLYILLQVRGIADLRFSHQSLSISHALMQCRYYFEKKLCWNIFAPGLPWSEQSLSQHYSCLSPRLTILTRRKHTSPSNPQRLESISQSFFRPRLVSAVPCGFTRTSVERALISLTLSQQVSRSATVLALYPALKRMGYGTNWKEAIVMVWGGLRGAVGLALALIVKLDAKIDDAHFQAHVVFFMGLMAAATLLINGTSMPFLLGVLGVTRTTPAKLEVLLHVVKVPGKHAEYT